jgi:hypothetical protein
MRRITTPRSAGRIRIGVLSAILPLALVAASCSRGDDTAIDGDTTPSPSAAPPTAAEQPDPSATPIPRPTPSPAVTSITEVIPTETAEPGEFRPWRSEIYTIGEVDPTLPPAEAEIVEAYLAFREAFLEASLGADPDPEHPGLQAYAADPQLSATRALLQTYESQGIAERFSSIPIHQLEVLVASVDEERAVLNICEVNDMVLYGTFDGAVLDDRIITRGIVADMSRTLEGWRTSGQSFVSESEGVIGCGRLDG